VLIDDLVGVRLDRPASRWVEQDAVVCVVVFDDGVGSGDAQHLRVVLDADQRGMPFGLVLGDLLLRDPQGFAREGARQAAWVQAAQGVGVDLPGTVVGGEQLVGGAAAGGRSAGARRDDAAAPPPGGAEGRSQPASSAARVSVAASTRRARGGIGLRVLGAGGCRFVGGPARGRPAAPGRRRGWGDRSCGRGTRTVLNGPVGAASRRRRAAPRQRAPGALLLSRPGRRSCASRAFAAGTRWGTRFGWRSPRGG
jgi:hypothetical protein